MCSSDLSLSVVPCSAPLARFVLAVSLFGFLFCSTLHANAQMTATFVQGVNGYTGATDTWLQAVSPNTSHGANETILVDADDNGLPAQALIRFDSLFGIGLNQVPIQSTLQSATLTFFTDDRGQGGLVHRMLRNWNGNDTWNSMGSGIQADGTDAVFTSTAQIGAPTGSEPARGVITTNITSDVQRWKDGEANFGWAILPYGNGTNGWRFASSEAANTNNRVKLTVNFTVAPEASPFTLLVLGGLVCAVITRVRFTRSARTI